MQKNFADEFALGIIDKDRKDIDYLSAFELINNNSESLILHKHREKHHYIIQINPAMERFIMKSAEHAGISLVDYGLPTDFEQLKRRAKQANSKHDDDFRRLFKALLRAGVEDLNRLAYFVRYLKEKNYAADIAHLRAI